LVEEVWLPFKRTSQIQTFTTKLKTCQLETSGSNRMVKKKEAYVILEEHKVNRGSRSKPINTVD